MSLSDRLALLINDEYKSERDFARKVGLNQKTVNNIVNNQNSPNHSVVAKILKSIPNLSAEWLIRGEGPMWKEGPAPETQEPTTTKDKGKDWDEVTLKEFYELMQDTTKKLKG